MGDTNDAGMEALIAEAEASLEDGEEKAVPTSAAKQPSGEATPKPAQDAPGKPPAWTYEDFIARYESDAGFRKIVDEKHIQVQANALFQKQRDRDARAARKAELAEAARNPDRAATRARAELEQLEAEDSQTRSTSAAVQQQLEAIARDDDDGPYYAELYKRETGEKLTARLREDPQAGLRWIRREVRKLAVESEAKKTTPALAEAMAAHKTNERLANLPIPPTAATAAGVSDADFLVAYSEGKNDDHARASKLLGL